VAERGGTRWQRFKRAVARVRVRNAGAESRRVDGAVREALALVRAQRRQIVTDRQHGHR
jgi:hypothetical protein